MIANHVKAGIICLCALCISNNSLAQTPGKPIKNVVLVHGAWADGSGWKGVYDILVNDGFNVGIVRLSSCNAGALSWRRNRRRSKA